MPIYDNFGIYIHVPFCAKPCKYCRFYKKIPTGDDIAFYLSTLEQEIKIFQEQNRNVKVPETMFFGGGTPSILTTEQILQLPKILGSLKPTTEWTVEVSPSTITKSKLEAFKEIGVNRISLGVQSFSEKTLNTLGRAHSLAETLKAIELVSEVSFKNFSLDLIFGANGQTIEDFVYDLQTASQTPVNHISAYCLEFESGTSVCAGLKTDEAMAKNEHDAELFETAMSVLPSLQFEQYEISNYAKSADSRCLHNLSTWNMAQWIGFGPAGASQFNGRRFRNPATIKKWAEGVQNKNQEFEDIVILDDDELFSSALIFGLRMTAGIDFAELKKRFPNANFGKYELPLSELAEQNLIEINNNKIKLTSLGKLYADSIAVELL